MASSRGTAPSLLLMAVSSCVAAVVCWAYRVRSFTAAQHQPVTVQFMDIWSAAATGDADTADDAIEDEDVQDGDSPTGGAAADEDGLDEVVVDPIISSMSASDQTRMAVINEVRRQFHRTITPLDKESIEGTESAVTEESKLTRSALLMTRMMRVVGEKAADLVELQDLPSDTLNSAQSFEYFLLPSSTKLRTLLANETSRAADLFFRQNVIAARKELRQAAPQLAALSNVQLPFLLPVQSGLPRPILLKPEVLLDAIAPELSADEQAYAYALEQLAAEVYGSDMADFLAGRTVSNPSSLVQQVTTVFSNTLTSGAQEASKALQPEFLSNLRKRISDTEVGELALDLQSLDEQDQKVLREWVTEVLEKGWQTLLRRIAPFTGE